MAKYKEERSQLHARIDKTLTAIKQLLEEVD